MKWKRKIRHEHPPRTDISCVWYGGGREIGASLGVVNMFGHEIQFESGIRPRVLWAPDTYTGALPNILNENIEALSRVRDIVLTHPHLDHIGAIIVQLLRMPPRTLQNLRIWMTQETWRFLVLQLTQTINSMGGRNPAWKGHEPLFTARDIELLKTYVHLVKFGEVVELSDTIAMIPVPTGHILGAAAYLLIKKLPNGGDARVFVTGDTSDKDQFFINGATRPKLSVDMLISDGTNLGKVQDALEEPVEGFIESDSILGTVNRGGIIVVPTLSIHREPDNIARFRTAGIEKVANFYIDGGREAVRIFTECLPPEKRGILENLRFISGRRDREAVLRERRAVVIAAGGMFPERSPAHWWLTRGVEHDDFSFIINNWQDPCSPGASLLSHREDNGNGHTHSHEKTDLRAITIGEEVFQVRCQVHRLAVSSHQEEGEFERMLDVLSPRLTVVTHAEYHQARRYLEKKGSQRLVYPKHGKEVGV